jgi:hypothetical protein
MFGKLFSSCDLRSALIARKRWYEDIQDHQACGLRLVDSIVALPTISALAFSHGRRLFKIRWTYDNPRRRALGWIGYEQLTRLQASFAGTNLSNVDDVPWA